MVAVMDGFGEAFQPLRQSWATALAALAGAVIATGCNSSQIPCSSSVPSYCASAAQPICSWSVYSDAASFSCQYTLLSTACGPYDIAYQRGVDTGVESYYDRSTGQLVAALFLNAEFDKTSCLAGPGAFPQPSCPLSEFISSCPDAGP
jgi:hypothetical protein